MEALKKRYIWIKELVEIEPTISAYEVLVKAKKKYKNKVEMPESDRMLEIRKQYLKQDF